MEVGEDSLATDNTDETYSSEEAGDSLFDYGDVTGNKEPGAEMLQIERPLNSVSMHLYVTCTDNVVDLSSANICRHKFNRGRHRVTKVQLHEGGRAEGAAREHAPAISRNRR